MPRRLVQRRAKRRTLAAAILGSAIALIDGSIVNVALPAIEGDLGGGLAGQQWVINAYLLTLGSLILLGGSLGDVYGAQRLFAIGVAGFGLASLLCAIAPTIETLIAARAAQGVAGAFLTPASLALIASTFADGSERAAAIGSWTAWGGIAAVVGPLVGGLIIEATTWRWIFGVNVPLVIVTLILLRHALSNDERVGHTMRTIDVPGALLAAIGLLAAVYALVEQPSRGWTSPVVLAGLAGGILLLAAFVLWELRTSDPMLPCGLFSRRNFAFANLETFFVYAGLSSLFFFLTIFLQQVAGWSALASGLAGVPVTLLLFLLSRRIGALSSRLGPRLFMSVGPLVAAAGVLLLVRADEDVGYATQILPAMVLFGIGLALTVAPLTAAVMADAGLGNSGIASGVNNAIARVAALVGIAGVGVAVASESRAEIDVGGYRVGMILTAVLLATGGIVGLVGIRNSTRAQSQWGVAVSRIVPSSAGTGGQTRDSTGAT